MRSYDSRPTPAHQVIATQLPGLDDDTPDELLEWLVAQQIEYESGRDGTLILQTATQGKLEGQPGDFLLYYPDAKLLGFLLPELFHEQYRKEDVRTEYVRAIVGAVSYKNWEFRTWPMGDGHLLQIVFVAPDTHTHEPATQYCRKWWIDPNMTPNELIRTCYAAVEMAEKHEAGEEFRYNGLRVANPHMPVNALAALHTAQPGHPLFVDDTRNQPPRDDAGPIPVPTDGHS